MHTTKSSAKNATNQNPLHVWQNYRPTASINFSDIVEDRTIYDDTRTDVTFDSNEITSRSSIGNNNKSTAEPEFDADAVSVDDILGNSIVHEIRHLSQSRQSVASHNISVPLSHSMPKNSGISFNAFTSDSLLRESFRPAEEVHQSIEFIFQHIVFGFKINY